MQNKYLIQFSRKFWFWFWEKLMNGFAPSNLEGDYKRPKGIEIDSDYDINKENGKIFLLVGSSCPWCHRALLIYQLKNLFNQIKIIFLIADTENGEWIFKEKLKGCSRLTEFYKQANKKNFFRATLPVLVSYENKNIKILSNESSQIIRILNSIQNFSNPQSLLIKDCNPKFLNLIHQNINDGVYQCGFARNQSSYEKASKSLFSALKEVENALDKNWICGDDLTYADIYLFPTLIRWELIYSKLFKCTEKEISEFKKIIQWRLKFFNLPNVNKSCFENDWKKDYYKALFPLNPNQIIPVLPSLKEILGSDIN